MRSLKKNRITGILALLLLCTIGLKMCVTIFNRINTCNESVSIEKSSEEGKDDKKEDVDGKKKFFADKRLFAEHLNYSWVSHIKPVCRYKMQQPAEPHQTVPTPPPNYCA
ncbi:hypothetical protein [Mucilaginibacter pedocola]|uniref:Uncharacterized protein n=1 Tax=Mucilaginibacter pedocola TaxID=1792845 RepID=A0A1S9PFC9_9SPHI|nr:hypothetical protein [Mucilaginibacter pedocola]OOQ59642.1 hypothetical protein BC343_05625 [Mucilaginibacter pedocola]